jgi:hypothetical protein
LDNFTNSITFVINEKITKRRTGTTGQSCLCIIRGKNLIRKNIRFSDEAVWRIQSTSIQVHATGQGEQETSSYSGTIYCLYSKTGSQSYQRHKSSGIIHGFIYQQSSKNGTGRISIKTRPWQKKEGELNYPLIVTDFVSKSLHRFIVSSSRMLNAIIF